MDYEKEWKSLKQTIEATIKSMDVSREELLRENPNHKHEQVDGERIAFLNVLAYMNSIEKREK